MAYSDFSLSRVKKVFELTETSVSLFGDVAPLEPSSWIQETLRYSLKLARFSSSEKARSEFIIAPILIEIERHNLSKISIYSG